MDIKHSILAEKYRPKDLSGYVGNEKLKSFIQTCINNNDIPHMLLYGEPGTGKTSLAKLIVNNIDCDYLYINSSDERGIDTIRDKVSRFASSVSFSPLKVVVLDEADYITPTAQGALRHTIELFSLNTRFILTCNYVEKIIEPLKSRCQTIKIQPPDKSQIAEHLDGILKNEHTEYDSQDLVLIVNKHYPDMRKMLNSIQLFTNKETNRLIIDNEILTSGVYINQVIQKLKNPNYNTIKEIRQIIANSNVSDYDELYRQLFDQVESYVTGINIGLAIIIIEEYLYKSNWIIDKEINVIACLSKLLTLKK
jgi:DNA polymerase III delta prime subunit